MSEIATALRAPFDEETVRSLHAGDRVLLSGTIYTARDAAHRRMDEAIRAGGRLPFPPEGAVIFYAGPAPARPGSVIGPIGPTTSGRMDTYTPALLERGVRGTIGKGSRSRDVLDAMRRFPAVYFGATGGAGALLSKCITAAKVIAFDELGPEAIRELTVVDFPLLVINDCHGGELYVQPDRKAAGLE